MKSGGCLNRRGEHRETRSGNHNGEEWREWTGETNDHSERAEGRDRSGNGPYMAVGKQNDRKTKNPEEEK